jgi:hypothetical protein
MVRRIFVTTMVVAISLLVAVKPAVAAPYVIVKVSPQVRRNWSVIREVARIDRYTGSEIAVRTACEARRKCIFVKEAASNHCGGAPACTTFHGQYLVLLELRTGLATKYRQGTVRHELGHAFGLWYHHYRNCHRAMFHSVSCPGGRPVGTSYTASEQRILQRY